MAQIKGHGSFLDRTTEDLPLPARGNLQRPNRWSKCKVCHRDTIFTITGRRAVRKSAGDGRRWNPNRFHYAGGYALIVYESTCGTCDTAKWTATHVSDYSFLRTFGYGHMPANPILQIEQAKIDARHRESAYAEAHYELARVERERLQNYEDPKYLEWDAIAVAL